jgi:hypothetical protein
MALLATQPAENRAHQQFRVDPIALGTPVLAGHSDACGMDDIGLDCLCLQPARQPESVPPGLIGADDPPDRLPGLACFIAPALQQLQQSARVRIKLLQWTPLDSRKHRRNEPLRLAHLDYRDQCAILLEGGEGPAGVKRLRHGDLPGVITAPEDVHTLAAASPHSIWIDESIR